MYNLDAAWETKTQIIFWSPNICWEFLLLKTVWHVSRTRYYALSHSDRARFLPVFVSCLSTSVSSGVRKSLPINFGGRLIASRTTKGVLHSGRRISTFRRNILRLIHLQGVADLWCSLVQSLDEQSPVTKYSEHKWVMHRTLRRFRRFGVTYCVHLRGKHKAGDLQNLNFCRVQTFLKCTASVFRE
jgi:hypothetical protein